MQGWEGVRRRRLRWGCAAVLTFTVLYSELVDDVLASAASPIGRTLRQISPGCSNRSAASSAKAETSSQTSRGIRPDKSTMPIAIWTGGQETSVPPLMALRLAKVLQSKNPRIGVTPSQRTVGTQTDLRRNGQGLRVRAGGRCSSGRSQIRRDAASWAGWLLVERLPGFARRCGTTANPQGVRRKRLLVLREFAITCQFIVAGALVPLTLNAVLPQTRPATSVLETCSPPRPAGLLGCVGLRLKPSQSANFTHRGLRR